MASTAEVVSSFGWRTVFYSNAVISVLVGVAWYAFMFSSPQQHPRIASEERAFLIRQLKPDRAVVVPWKQILTSMPVWSLVVTNFASNFAFYTFLTFLPEYFEMMLGYDFESTGFLAVTPYLTQLVGALVSGFLADKLAHGGHSLVLIRKAFTLIAFLIPAIGLSILPFISDRTACVIIFSIAIGFSGFIDGGCAVNHLDIAPRYVGILKGLGNMFGTIPGILSPILTGYILDQGGCPTEDDPKPLTASCEMSWRIVFFLSVGVYLFGALFYVLFAKAHLLIYPSEDAEEEEEALVYKAIPPQA